jgi:hypothetical protein
MLSDSAADRKGRPGCTVPGTRCLVLTSDAEARARGTEPGTRSQHRARSTEPGTVYLAPCTLSHPFAPPPSVWDSAVAGNHLGADSFRVCIAAAQGDEWKPSWS